MKQKIILTIITLSIPTFLLIAMYFSLEFNTLIGNILFGLIALFYLITVDGYVLFVRKIWKK